MADAKPSRPRGNSWLEEDGPHALESLFRAVTLNPSVPVLLADDERRYREASSGAGKLLGLPRKQIIGHPIDDFVEPEFKPQMPVLWQDFLEQGEQQGTLPLMGADGFPREVEYIAKGHVLPVRHLLVLRDKAAEAGPSSVDDYALFLLNEQGCVAAWYAGAERLYGYSSEEMQGRDFAGFEALDSKPSDPNPCIEGWQTKKDGSQFWANRIAVALRNASGQLQGFAVVVRDFSEAHGRAGNTRPGAARRHSRAHEAPVEGIVFAEFESISEANDIFLQLAGYSRAELAEGGLSWVDLTPAQYAAADGRAHEEALRFGACARYEKELIRKDGTRIPVELTTAILKLYPFRSITLIGDLRERRRLEEVEERPGSAESEFKEMVGVSAALKRILRQVEVVAPTDATVLILGETGTGKELVARAIHRLSPRQDMPWVTLNCAAIPTGLLESELFGYERGAFTGALSQKIGRFEMAHRGTLFLDEVGDIPLDLQPKLLRALQEKSFERLGGTKTIPIDVRLVAATNRDLNQMMGDKLFRSDLYYRLKVFPITVPPLRDRPEDIPILARHFTAKYSAKMNRQIDKIPAETMSALMDWNWPGNVRELENFIERAVILSRGPVLRAPLKEIQEDAPPQGGNSTLEQVEREHIIRVFRESGGVVTTAATRLGLHRTTLNAMMRKLGISRHDL
jgi:PAS domain S-box-containing protein